MCERSPVALRTVVQPVPASLQARLSRLAARIALGRRSDSIPEAIALACDLAVADVLTPGVLEVASLDSDATWRDSSDHILEMLKGLGFEAPEVADESTAWPLILRAFASWDLPLNDFYAPFLQRLPAWDKQDALDRSLNLLLDELDHATEIQAGEAVVARMRATVREAIN
jgi:hypothetical protein